MRKLFQGLSGGAWGVLIGKWMRERVSVLEVEETANVVFAFSEEAGSGEPNPGLRPKNRVNGKKGATHRMSKLCEKLKI